MQTRIAVIMEFDTIEDTSVAITSPSHIHNLLKQSFPLIIQYFLTIQKEKNI
jgi:hypothetical protein